MQILAQSARAGPDTWAKVVQILYYCAWAKRASTGLHGLARSCMVLFDVYKAANFQEVQFRGLADLLVNRQEE